MKRFLSLLFLSFLCTCAIAQKGAINPEAQQEATGFGTLLVEFGDNTWTLTLSSGDYFKKIRYITEAKFRRSPKLYNGFIIVPGNDRYDLRMVHQLIERLSGEGWKMIFSNFNHSQSANDWGTEIKEVIFYQFSVPVGYGRKQVATVSGDAEEVLPVTVTNRDQQRIRGALSRYDNETASLKIEELVGGRWIEHYSLVGQGMLSKDVVKRIRNISASKDKLSFRVEMPNGNYDYHFIRGGGNGYYFGGLHFVSKEDCGMVQYNLRLLQTVDGWLTGFYQPEPCVSEAQLQQVNGQYPIQRTWLQDFIPGTQRIEVEDTKQVLFY